MQDPEEIARKLFRAKCRFRALTRQVISNLYWLVEGIEDYEGVEDVQRRVKQAVRGKKKKQLLSINDKALLNKPALERTDQEKHYLYRIIGGLKCFKRYPNHVKKKLAAVTYFKYYGPNRTVVRQDHDAHALYFIVTGDVIVTQVIFDDLLKQHVTLQVGDMHVGDMFGEISLLHNINRTATVTTVGHCEFLALMKYDFKNVLQASIQKQWDEVRRAMSSFSYFESLDDLAQREGCIVAKMRSFEPNETLLGDGSGVPNFVYFVLSGQCQMIESIQVQVKKRSGKEFYSLYDPYIAPEESDHNLDKYFIHYQKKLEDMARKSSEKTLESASPKEESIDKQQEKEKKLSKDNNSNKSGSLKNIQEKESDKEQKELEDKTFKAKGNASAKEESIDKQQEEEKEKKVSLDLSKDNNSNKSGSLKNIKAKEADTEQKDLEDKTFEAKRNRNPSLLSNQVNDIRTYFMQVCILKAGACFGFGENMRDRRIIALNHVDCMLLPKLWLLQRNTANIWTRIQYYLEKKIPSKKKMFHEFVTNRQWATYRQQLVNDVISRRNKSINTTTIHDVPYSIRMNELYDI